MHLENIKSGKYEFVNGEFAFASIIEQEEAEKEKQAEQV